jgi:hypothetical protein
MVPSFYLDILPLLGVQCIKPNHSPSLTKNGTRGLEFITLGLFAPIHHSNWSAQKGVPAPFPSSLTTTRLHHVTPGRRRTGTLCRAGRPHSSLSKTDPDSTATTKLSHRKNEKNAKFAENNNIKTF